MDASEFDRLTASMSETEILSTLFAMMEEMLAEMPNTPPPAPTAPAAAAPAPPPAPPAPPPAPPAPPPAPAAPPPAPPVAFGLVLNTKPQPGYAAPAHPAKFQQQRSIVSNEDMCDGAVCAGDIGQRQPELALPVEATLPPMASTPKYVYFGKFCIKMYIGFFFYFRVICGHI